MKKRLREISAIIGGILVGDPDISITGVAPIEEAKAGDITLLSDKRLVDYLKTTDASCVIVPPDVETERCATIKSEDPWDAMSKLLPLFVPPVIPPPGIDGRAHLGENCEVAEDVRIGYQSYVGEACKIAEGAVIFPFSYIGDKTNIGRDTVIYPHVTIRECTVIGQRVIVHSGAVIGSDGFGYTRVDHGYRKIPQVGKVVIGDDVEIGANVAIDRGTIGATVIRSGVKIDNLVHIAHNVEIGENSLLVAQVGIAGSTEIGKGCILAGQVGVVDHVKLGDGVIAGAQSGITKSVPAHTRVSGYPARAHYKSKRAYAALLNLPDLLKRVSRLERAMRRLSASDG